jgi:hypothetical protein
MFELVKRDGRRQQYDRAKLVRSLMRAGARLDMIARALALIEPWPGLNTTVLRSRVEAELERRQPNAARRYATTRSFVVHPSEQAGYGWVCMNPEAASRLGLRSGDTVWLCDGGTQAPFSIDSCENVAPGQAWLNPREMAAMEAGEGIKLAASSAYHEARPLSEGRQVTGRDRTAVLTPDGTAGSG